MTEIRSTVILGSGCAGLTAAHLQRPRGAEPAGFGGPRARRPALDHHLGGKLSGLPEGIQGPELIDNMKKQAMRFGATLELRT